MAPWGVPVCMALQVMPTVGASDKPGEHHSSPLLLQHSSALGHLLSSASSALLALSRRVPSVPDALCQRRGRHRSAAAACCTSAAARAPPPPPLNGASRSSLRSHACMGPPPPE
eukprot:TRINITY_DN25728_c0_g1_i1.p1 TRINITY_DN25728_c0_g1~~TRINITY_DN25728_c0_g1_i1.p1  ORF type:complete len:114 (+),score=17.42 TRINITY_DN25728_c0_g1_i1:119-460(+)